MTIADWIEANSVWIVFVVTILVLVYYIVIVIKTFKKRRRIITPLAFILTVWGLLFFIYIVFMGTRIEPASWAQILLLGGLVSITAAYAYSTEKMAEEMGEQRYDAVRPAIDFKRGIAKGDTVLIDIVVRQTLEANAASSEDVSHGLSCILGNVGLGPAIDVRSFIQHPERGRLPCEFGTLKSGEETKRKILSISHEGNRVALVASYEDIYGRTLESSREVSIDKENHNWKLGRLKVVPVKEGD